MLPAVILMGVFVSILVEVGWGTDPASFMNLNVATALGWGLGNTQVLLYGIMLIFTFAFGPQMIGFGTLANMLLIGYVVDFCRWLWPKIGFAQFIQEGTFATRLAVFSATILLFVIVAAIYMNAKMGVAPYDATPVIISGLIPQVPFFVIRIIFDLSAVAAGLIAGKLCGAVQGSLVGSIAMSLLLGPAISLVGRLTERVL